MIPGQDFAAASWSGKHNRCEMLGVKETSDSHRVCQAGDRRFFAQPMLLRQVVNGSNRVALARDSGDSYGRVPGLSAELRNRRAKAV